MGAVIINDWKADVKIIKIYIIPMHPKFFLSRDDSLFARANG